MPDKSASSLRIWVLTDGKIGDDVQCLAVAQALSPSVEKRVIAPRAPWVWAAPWGPIAPRDHPRRVGSPIHGPAPDIVIASGRRVISYAWAIKQASDGRTKIVVLKDPRLGRAGADVIWAPSHDRLEGPNIFSTLTSPHGLGARIDEARKAPAPETEALRKPMLGVVLGGASGGARYGAGEAEFLADRLRLAAKNYRSIAVTPSRRTPEGFMQILRDQLDGDHCHIWNGEGDNPYIDILEQADALIVAADSHNMMSEAVATGAGVYAYRPPGLAPKMAWFVDQLERKGVVRPLDQQMTPFACAPINATPEIVAAIKKRLGL